MIQQIFSPGTIISEPRVTNPSTLQPGQIAPFDLIIIEGRIPTYLMAYYSETEAVDYSDFGTTNLPL